MSVLELSRGSVWKTHPALPPYLVATPGDPWSDGGSAYVVFTDTSGGQLDRIDADSVTADAITFLADPERVDPIPGGANFEIFIDTDDGPRKIRYGKVIRREVEYPDSPAIQQQSVALQFTDTFPTLGLRSNWIKLLGAPKVLSNAPLPNGVGPAQVLLGEAKAAMRWDQELNHDTTRMKIRLLDRGNGTLLFDFAHTTAIVAADHRLTTGLAVRFTTSEAEGKVLRLCTLNGGPNNLTYMSAAIPHIIPDNGDYTIYYDASGDSLSVYAGTNTTPLASWTDDVHAIPHGPGYRHFGASWHNTQLNAGIMLTYISAKDDV
jgi:hypothetical protein